MPNIGPLEILIVLLLVVLPVVLIVTLVRRSRRYRCWRCGTRVDSGQPTCPSCGAQQVPGTASD